MAAIKIPEIQVSHEKMLEQPAGKQLPARAEVVEEAFPGLNFPLLRVGNMNNGGFVSRTLPDPLEQCSAFRSGQTGDAQWHPAMGKGFPVFVYFLRRGTGIAAIQAESRGLWQAADRSEFM
jgi:hypothetical protein